jgi:hypothetical protein
VFYIFINAYGISWRLTGLTQIMAVYGASLRSVAVRAVFIIEAIDADFDFY